MKSRLVVVAVIKKDDSILLARKAPGRGPYPDTWHLIGGGVNLDKETCDEAMIREIKEEAGIEVKNLEKVSWRTDVEPDKHGEPTYFVFLVYNCDYASGEAKAGDDIEKIEWVPLADLKNYELTRPGAQHLQAGGFKL